MSLKRYTVGDDGNISKIIKDTGVPWKIKIGDDDYRLKGCCVHSGTMNGGHYMYVVVNHDKSGVLCNDSTVTSITELEVIKHIGPSGYVFLFKRITPKASSSSGGGSSTSSTKTRQVKINHKLKNNGTRRRRK